MWSREARLVRELPVTLSAEELDTTARVLRQLRELLPNGGQTASEGRA